MWRYDDLLIITEVIKQGSFIKASQKIGIPSSTVSRRVSEFESALGVRLIERNSRKLSLTDKGELLFEQCNPQMQKIKRSIESISSNNSKAAGVLRVTAPVTLSNDTLNNWFCDFSKLYPEINLDIVLSNNYEDILDDSFDVAIRVGPLKDSEFIAQLLFTSEMVLCASKAYIAHANIDFDNINTLVKNEFLSYQQSKQHLKLKNKVTNNNIEILIKSRMTATSTGILRQAALNGLGITCLPIVSIKDEIKSGELVHIFKDFIGHQRKDIFAVYPSKKHLSGKMAVFLSYMKKQAKTL